MVWRALLKLPHCHGWVKFIWWFPARWVFRITEHPLLGEVLSAMLILILQVDRYTISFRNSTTVYNFLGCDYLCPTGLVSKGIASGKPSSVESGDRRHLGKMSRGSVASTELRRLSRSV